MDGFLWIACVGGSHRKVDAFQHVRSQIRSQIRSQFRSQFRLQFRADKKGNGASGALKSSHGGSGGPKWSPGGDPGSSNALVSNESRESLGGP